MVKGEKTVERKTSSQIFDEKQASIAKDNIRLGPQLNEVLVALEGKLERYGQGEGKMNLRQGFRIPMSIGFGSGENGHAEATRLNVDTRVIGCILRSVSAYTEGVTKSLSDLWMTIDAQNWAPEKCNAVLTAVQNDVKSHTEDIFSLLRRGNENLAKAVSYDEVMKHATTLMLDLNAISESVYDHINGIARQAEVAYLRRN
jgi:hypothetical protein